MAEAQFNHPVPELTEQEDAEALAAIGHGLKDAKAERVVSIEEGRRSLRTAADRHWVVRSGDGSITVGTL